MNNFQYQERENRSPYSHYDPPQISSSTQQYNPSQNIYNPRPIDTRNNRFLDPKYSLDSTYQNLNSPNLPSAQSYYNNPSYMNRGRSANINRRSNIDSLYPNNPNQVDIYANDNRFNFQKLKDEIFSPGDEENSTTINNLGLFNNATHKNAQNDDNLRRFITKNYNTGSTLSSTYGYNNNTYNNYTGSINNNAAINETIRYNSILSPQMDNINLRTFSPSRDILASSTNNYNNYNPLYQNNTVNKPLYSDTPNMSMNNSNYYQSYPSSNLQNSFFQGSSILPYTTKPGKKTLILDLDETLVHSAFKPFYFNADIILNVNFEGVNHQIYVLKRPYVDEFLMKMAQHYEIVVFTASISQYANPVLDQLDKNRIISHRLFREHCVFRWGLYIKDLNKLGRNLKDTIIVDNNSICYSNNINNGIPIKTWHYDRTDNELLRLIPVLEYLAYVDDVRDVIKKIVNNEEVDFNAVNRMIGEKGNMGRNGNGNNISGAYGEKINNYISGSSTNYNNIYGASNSNYISDYKNNVNNINNVSNVNNVNSSNYMNNNVRSYTGNLYNGNTYGINNNNIGSSLKPLENTTSSFRDINNNLSLTNRNNNIQNELSSYSYLNQSSSNANSNPTTITSNYQIKPPSSPLSNTTTTQAPSYLSLSEPRPTPTYLSQSPISTPTYKSYLNDPIYSNNSYTSNLRPNQVNANTNINQSLNTNQSPNLNIIPVVPKPENSKEQQPINPPPKFNSQINNNLISTPTIPQSTPIPSNNLRLVSKPPTTISSLPQNSPSMQTNKFNQTDNSQLLSKSRSSFQTISSYKNQLSYTPVVNYRENNNLHSLNESELLNHNRTKNDFYDKKSSYTGTYLDRKKETTSNSLYNNYFGDANKRDYRNNNSMSNIANERGGYNNIYKNNNNVINSGNNNIKGDNIYDIEEEKSSINNSSSNNTSSNDIFMNSNNNIKNINDNLTNNLSITDKYLKGGITNNLNNNFTNVNSYNDNFRNNLSSNLGSTNYSNYSLNSNLNNINNNNFDNRIRQISSLGEINNNENKDILKRVYLDDNNKYKNNYNNNNLNNLNNLNNYDNEYEDEEESDDENDNSYEENEDNEDDYDDGSVNNNKYSINNNIGSKFRNDYLNDRNKTLDFNNKIDKLTKNYFMNNNNIDSDNEIKYNPIKDMGNINRINNYDSKRILSNIGFNSNTSNTANNNNFQRSDYGLKSSGGFNYSNNLNNLKSLNNVNLNINNHLYPNKNNDIDDLDDDDLNEREFLNKSTNNLPRYNLNSFNNLNSLTSLNSVNKIAPINPDLVFSSSTANSFNNFNLFKTNRKYSGVNKDSLSSLNTGKNNNNNIIQRFQNEIKNNMISPIRNYPDNRDVDSNNRMGNRRDIKSVDRPRTGYVGGSGIRRIAKPFDYLNGSRNNNLINNNGNGNSLMIKNDYLNNLYLNKTNFNSFSNYGKNISGVNNASGNYYNVTENLKDDEFNINKMNNRNNYGSGLINGNKLILFDGK